MLVNFFLTYLYIISIYYAYAGYIYTLCQKHVISLLLLYIYFYTLGKIYYHYNYRILQQQLYIISVYLIYIDGTYFSMLYLSFLLISTTQYRLLRFQRLLINLSLTVRVYILDPAALATSSQAVLSFQPYSNVEIGHVTLIEAYRSQQKYNLIIFQYSI